MARNHPVEGVHVKKYIHKYAVWHARLDRLFEAGEPVPFTKSEASLHLKRGWLTLLSDERNEYGENELDSTRDCQDGVDSELRGD